MIPEEQQSEIAKACGWTTYTPNTHGYLTDILFVSPNGIGSIELPDYLNDLNAMHEAEEILPVGERCEYLRTLGITDRNEKDIWIVAHATAKKRAEAFLRTIGKWKD